MKKFKIFLDQWGFLILIVLLLLIAFFVIRGFYKTPAQEDLKDYKEKVELINKLRDALADERTALYSTIDRYNAEIDNYQRQISNINKLVEANNNTIKELNKQRENLSRFNNYSSDELKEFFSNLR